MGHWNRYPNRLYIVFGAIATLLFVLEQVNGRFWLNDFRVYYGAGEALLRGAPLYGVAHGLDTGIFKYAPLLAFLYALFALLPYAVAASIQYLLITLAFLDGMRRIDRLVRKELLGGRAASYLPLFLTALVCVVHLHRELHLGNINMMLLWLVVVALEALIKGRAMVGGLLLGAVMLAKPHFVVLLPLLALHRRWRSIAFAFAAITIGVLLPALFLGWAEDLAIHRTWLGEMAAHNASLIYVGGDDHRSVNTVYSFLHRALLKHVVAPSGAEAYALLGVIALLFGLFVLRNRKKDRSFPFEFLILVALVPCITLTDTEHFLLATPVVAYIIHRLVPRAEPRWLALIAVPLLFLFGGNWEDALGSFSDTLIHYGALGIGCFGLIILAIMLWTGSNQKADPAS